MNRTFAFSNHAAVPAPAGLSAATSGGSSTMAPVSTFPGVPGRNRLLGRLVPEELERISPHLERVRFEQRQVLFEPDERIRFVYFPETMVVSLVSTMRGGATVEVGTAGCEGMAGLPLFLGDNSSSVSGFAQIPGFAMRLEAGLFVRLSSAPGAFHDMLLRYTHAFLMQVAQTAACNGAHLVEERCARWLLMTHDRVDGDEFPLTHEFMAFMLGVRRAGVTIAMRALQEAGTVSYTRGIGLRSSTARSSKPRRASAIR